ncbi:MAG TPA: hypothetical protein VK826_13020, partial [Bacteroidia bacterium]|nr:hypothetical protein [Bacteroidia bacterium]
MRAFFILVFVVLSNCLPAISIDSLQRQQLIREGQSELCQLIGENESVNPSSVDQMRFVVVVDGNSPGANYVTQTHIDSASVPILESATIDSINKYLRDAYVQYHIEMYMIIIKSLDVVVKTPLPASPTARQLFTQKLYDEQTNIAAVRAEHLSITNAIINSTFSARNRTCLIYSRAMYKGVVVASGKMSTWNFSKTLTHTASPSTYNYTVDLQDYFFSRIENNTQVTQAGTEYSLRTVAKEFYLSAKFISLKSAILTTYTPSALSAIFDLFEGEIDYENLTEQERIHALGVFAGYTMQGNMLGNEEFIAIDIIKYTPANQVATLLYDLALLSPLETNSSYHGEKNNEALIVMLIHEIDDGIIGNETDAYTEFVRAITILQLSNENAVSTHLPRTDQEWLDRSIYWDDTHWFTNAPIGCHDYTITLLNNGKVKVEKEVVDRYDEQIQGQSATIFYTPHWEDSYAP